MPTDNTAALQSMLNAGPVTLPANQVYYVTGLNVPHNFNLNGSTINYTPSTGACLRVTAPNITITNGAVIGPWDYRTANNTSGSAGITSTYDNVTISVIVLSQFSAYGCNQSGNNITFTHCTISKTGYTGYFYNSGATNTSVGEFSYNIVDRSMISNAWAPGVTQAAAQIRGSGSGSQIATNWNIHDNQFSMPSKPIDSSAGCVEIRYLTHANVYNNTFTGGTLGLSMVGSATDCINYNNTYTGQNNTAIEVGSSSNTSYNNTISNQFGNGILFDGNGSSNTVLNTVISGCAGNAIQMVPGVSNISISNTNIAIGANGKSGIYFQGTVPGVSLTDCTIDGAGHTSTSGIFFDTSTGGFTMIRGSITNCSNRVTVYAGSAGTVTDNLVFSCVNKPSGFTSGNISLNTHGTLGTNLTFNNSGCIDAPVISYSPATKKFTLNQAITPVTPASSGGPPASYALTGSLPAGLSFNTTTGVISGTPTALATATDYTVTATNSSGAGNTVVNLAVAPLIPVISYSPATEVYTQGTAISTLSPTNTGGTPASYSIAPALPAGLSFNTSTGAITGTPTAITTAIVYTISATNTTGTATTKLTITVNPATPIIAYSPSTLTKPINVAITPISPNNTGGTPASYSISPALPAGLSFNTATGVISGTPTVLLSSTVFTIHATNAGGTGTTTLTLIVNAGQPDISYSPATDIFTIGNAISPLTPINTGGIPNSYSVSPALPAGLHLDTASGIISGTPSAVTSQADYIVTGTNNAGSATFDLTITVKAQIPVISYTPASNTYVLNNPIVAWAPLNGGGIISSFSISPALPAGLNFDTATGIISGTPTALSGLTTYTITASNTGGTGTTQVTIVVESPTSTIWRKKIVFVG